MIQSNNRPFKNKPLSNIQQAQFSIGWRFCPVCGHKLYQKDESCSGTIRIIFIISGTTGLIAVKSRLLLHEQFKRPLLALCEIHSGCTSFPAGIKKRRYFLPQRG